MANTDIIQIDSPNSLLIEARDDMLNEVSKLSGLIYKGTVDDYIKWAQKNPYRQIATSINAYLSYLTKDRGLLPRTVAKKRSVLRHYVDCLHRMGVATSQDVSAVKSIKTPTAQGKRAGTWLNEEQLKQLVNAPKGDDQELRDRAILALLVGCALRVNEVANLRIDHFSDINGMAVIKNLSRKHHRVQEYIPIPNWTLNILKALPTEIFDGEYLFAGSSGKPLTTRTIYTIVTKYAKKCGFGKVSPHDMRRSAAEQAKKNGLPIDQISKLLGHSSILTTQRYLEDSFDLELTAQALEIFHQEL